MWSNGNGGVSNDSNYCVFIFVFKYNFIPSPPFPLFHILAHLAFFCTGQKNQQKKFYTGIIVNRFYIKQHKFDTPVWTNHECTGSPLVAKLCFDVWKIKHFCYPNLGINLFVLHRTNFPSALDTQCGQLALKNFQQFFIFYRQVSSFHIFFRIPKIELIFVSFFFLNSTYLAALQKNAYLSTFLSKFGTFCKHDNAANISFLFSSFFLPHLHKYSQTIKYFITVFCICLFPNSKCFVVLQNGAQFSTFVSKFGGFFEYLDIVNDL